MSGGYNNRHGIDSGPLPPGFCCTNTCDTCIVKICGDPFKPWLSGDHSTAFPNAPCFPTFREVIVPLSQTLKDFMATQLQNPNEDSSMNVIVELLNRKPGVYTRGMVHKGSVENRMRQTLRDVCWDSPGSGNSSENCVVHIWMTNNGYDP